MSYNEVIYFKIEEYRGIHWEHNYMYITMEIIIMFVVMEYIITTKHGAEIGLACPYNISKTNLFTDHTEK